MAYGFPESTEVKQPIPSFKTVEKRASWRKTTLGMDFWGFPLMKRFMGPKWADVIDPAASEGDPPNLNTDVIALDQHTPKFKIKFNKSFYFTVEYLENGVWVAAKSGIFEFDPASAWNFLTWDEWDIMNSSKANYEFRYIIDKIVEE